jgi:DNA-binding LacI/PurR family transcriptional regulator
MDDKSHAPQRLPTLDDVAALAGVGRGTVSRAINGAPNVSARSRAAVMAAVETLGYVPNRAARSLVTRRNDSVTLVISESEERFFSEPFFAAVVRGISGALAASSQTLLLTMVQTADQHRALENYLVSQHVDGVMMLSLHGQDPLPGRLESRGLPIVLGGRPPEGVEVSYVDVDNVAGARDAVRHLLTTGRRRVAVIGGPEDMAVSADRMSGYAGAHEELGLKLDPTLTEPGDFTEEGGRTAMKALLDRAPDIDAVFAASDLMAAGALRELDSRGRRVPADVAVVGFDDAPVARHTQPQLTTVHQPIEAMGRTMVELLLARIEGRPTQSYQVLAPHLVVRESS